MDICGICHSQDTEKCVTFSEHTEIKYRCQCKMKYHVQCLQEWFECVGKKTCPVCKTIALKSTNNSCVNIFGYCFVDRYVEHVMHHAESLLNRIMILNDYQIGTVGQCAVFCLWSVMSVGITLTIIVPYVLFKGTQYFVSEHILKDEFIDFGATI